MKDKGKDSFDDMDLLQGIEDIDLSAYVKEEKKFEETAKEMISDMLARFKSGLKKEKELFVDNTDSEYWVAICFQTREQKEEFLQKTGLIKYGDKYLDGIIVAEELGVELKNKAPAVRRVKIHTDYRTLSV